MKNEIWKEINDIPNYEVVMVERKLPMDTYGSIKQRTIINNLIFTLIYATIILVVRTTN